ncbi:MAG: hypothetical protein K2L95_03505 [Alphaproteobacteria bacterium]|nr:hypothetical protein [Alphaproteobacteria bacterium]
MKKLCGAIMLGLMAPAAAHAAWQCATNVQNYSASCSPTVQQYCCPNGQRETTYSCPMGWTVSGTTCVRNGTTSGSDSTGTYEISYGSCDAESKTVECCTLTTNPNDAKTCLMCINGVQ